MALENVFHIRMSMVLLYTLVMEPENAMLVQEWGKLVIQCVAYVMEVENVGTAVEQGNARDVEVQVK